jgi:hypothetical protein
MLSERLKQQGCHGQITYKEWARMRYPEESRIPNSKEAVEWGVLNFGGWMMWWKI